MELIITGRRGSVTPELKKFIEERAKRLEKFVSKPMQATITLKTEKHRQIAEAHVNLNGVVLQAVEETEEIHLAVDNVLAKIEKQLKKYKEKSADHRVHVKAEPAKKSKKTADLILPKTREERPLVMAGKETFRITKREKFSINLLSVSEAALEMNASKKEFLLFRTGAQGQLKVIYKKKGGALGLMECIDTAGAA
jgi:putative sigma-54 modulation protein